MKKKSIAVFIAIIIMSLLCVNVYATISGDISLTPSETTSFSPGESFTVTLSLSELSGVDGIDSISGYIDIDEDVLDDLTIESIVTNSDGQVEIGDSNVLDVYEASAVSSSYDYGIVFNTSPTSGKGDYRLVIDVEEVISSGTDLVTITYVVSSDAEIGTYEDAITYSSFVIYEGSTNKYAMEDKSIDITIVGDSTSSDDDSDGTEETVDLEGIQLNITDTTLTLDSDDITLSVSADPTNAELPDIIWTLSEEGIVEITDNGDGTITVTPISTGTVTITATTEDGEFSASCEITVTESSSSSDSDSDDDSSTSDSDSSSSTDDDSSSSSSSSDSDSDSDSTSSTTTDDDDTTADGSLPYTGIKYALLPITILAVAGFVFYKKYAKYKDIK